eukprot:1981166-Rhodomonas_salina.1
MSVQDIAKRTLCQYRTSPSAGGRQLAAQTVTESSRPTCSSIAYVSSAGTAHSEGAGDVTRQPKMEARSPIMAVVKPTMQSATLKHAHLIAA